MNYAVARGLLACCLWLLQAHAVAASEEQSTEQLPAFESVQLTFQHADPGVRPPDSREILGQLRRAAAAASRVPTQEHRSDTSTLWVERSGSQVTVDAPESLVLIQYGAQSRYLKDNTLVGTTMVIKVRCRIVSTPERTRVTLDFPSEAVVTYKKLLLPARKFDSLPAIFEDYRGMAGAMARTQLQLNSSLTGELESKYRPEAVAGNFERLWGRPTSAFTSPGAVQRTYMVNAGTTRQPVTVAIYPYRDGTKISYRADVSYILRPDGTTQGGGAASTLREAIERVVND
jgi:hypothetical protein